MTDKLPAALPSFQRPLSVTDQVKVRVTSRAKGLCLSIALGITGSIGAVSGTALAQGADDCASAQPIIGAGVFSVDSVGATTDGPIDCVTIGNDVWFAWLATSTDTFTIDTCTGVAYDTVLTAYSGTCGSLNQLSCDDDTCGAQSLVSVNATNGTTYLIRVGGYNGATGTATLTIAGGGSAGGCSNPSVGGDVTVGSIPSINNYGSLGGIAAYALGTTACNLGDSDLNWVGSSSEHPVIAQNIYRLEEGRFEQIGLSYLHHGFTALQQSLCCTCIPAANSTLLGPGCSNPTGSGLSGSQSSLGPRSEVNAFTGTFSYPFSQQGQTGNLIFKRIQVPNDGVNPTLHPNAQYFGEAQYVMPDDAGAGNGTNNVAWVNLSRPGSTVGGAYRLNISGQTHREEPAIYSWADSDPGVMLDEVNVPGEGQFIAGSHAIDNGDGTWRYEYAIFNNNSHHSGQRFTAPLGLGVNVMDVGMSFPSYHSGEPFTNTPWNSSVNAATGVTWSTESFSANSSANAIRWGTTYSFWFTADAPPQVATGTLGLFRPGNPGDQPIALLGAGGASGVDCGSATLVRTPGLGAPFGPQNVGDHVGFRIAGTPGGIGPWSYEWSVDGSQSAALIVKDYQERVHLGDWSVTPMGIAEFTAGDSLEFYWKPLPSQIAPGPGDPLPRQVSVEIVDSLGTTTCSLELDLTVERNTTDVLKQPVDFYTSNHDSALLGDHENWHNTVDFNGSPNRGSRFFTFHSAFVRRFALYRELFGYESIGTWDPGTPLPTDPVADYDVLAGGSGDPVDRSSSYSPAQHALPRWFSWPVPATASPIRTFGLPDSMPFGQNALFEEPGCDGSCVGFTTLNQLGSAVISPYHNFVHVDVGGVMATLQSPRDGIFWRWHNFATGICVEWLDGPGPNSMKAPHVTEVTPEPTFPRRTSILSEFRLEFQRSVTGVVAQNLTVAGAAATSVSGSGKGPYVFSGFPIPGIGPVPVTLAPGFIVGAADLRPYQGDTWDYEVMDPLADADSDGVSNGDEIHIHLSNARNADTDHDGLEDALEIAFGWSPTDPFDPAPQSIGVTYCTSLPNSTGSTASLEVLGVAHAHSMHETLMRASDVPPNTFGFFLASMNANQAPLGAGILCLGSPIGRFIDGVSSSGTTGVLEDYFWTGALPLASSPAVFSGDTWRFQCWFRDGGTSNLSDGAAVTFH